LKKGLKKGGDFRGFSDLRIWIDTLPLLRRNEEVEK